MKILTYLERSENNIGFLMFRKTSQLAKSKVSRMSY